MDIKALLKDPSFAAKLKEAADIDSALKLFEEAGFPVSAEELKQLARDCRNELSDAELDRVAGGKEDKLTYIAWLLYD